MVVVLLAPSQSLAAGNMQNTDSQPVPTPWFSTEGAHPNTPTLGTLAENGSGEQFEDEKQKGGVEEKRGLVQIL